MLVSAMTIPVRLVEDYSVVCLSGGHENRVRGLSEGKKPLG